MGIFNCEYHYIRYEVLVDTTITQRWKRIMGRLEK